MVVTIYPISANVNAFLCSSDDFCAFYNLALQYLSNSPDKSTVRVDFIEKLSIFYQSFVYFPRSIGGFSNKLHIVDVSLPCCAGAPILLCCAHLIFPKQRRLTHYDRKLSGNAAK